MFASKEIDWASARVDFVQTETQPTYAELAEKYHCSPGSIGRIASQEGWPALRANYLEKKLKESEAMGVLLEAINGCDPAIIRSATSFALVALSSLTAAIEGIQEDRAPQTKVDVINTASFAFANIAKGLRDCGILGLSKSLDIAGKEGNGQWNPKLLQQINVTVQGVLQKHEQAETAVKAEAKGKRRGARSDITQPMSASDITTQADAAGGPHGLSQADDVAPSSAPGRAPSHTAGNVAADDID